MTRIDFGTLYEFEREDETRRLENRQKIQNFLALCEAHNATVIEQRDWNTQDLIHFVGISPHLVVTITVSEKYLGVQTSQIREKFPTYKADYVSVPDRQAVSVEQPPAEKMGLHDVISCPACNKPTPFDGFFQHCVRCGEKLDTLVKTCKACDNGILYHPSFSCCPTCGSEMIPDYDSPPLNELDPHGLIWGIPSKEEPPEDGEDLFPPDSGPVG
ncbi:MAG: hypothetical protein O2954_02690 [bacterium]|nr:hypothetical protein [bacterium]